MKRLHLIFLIMCMAMVAHSWAAVVSEHHAQQVATRFMHNISGANVKMRLVHKASSLNASAPTPFYVFNAESKDGGYVIVAGDDRVSAVLAYSDNGTFETNDVPEAMQNWLDGYAAQIAALDEGIPVAAHVSSTQPIAPLLTAQWSQNAPYNIQFPYLPSGDHAYVGCVATAMAQVMYYWRWPQRPSSVIPSYVSETLSITMPQLPIISFNWNAMKDTYLTTDASEAATAVSKLSLYCAQAVKMDFMNNSSSANSGDIHSALTRYFGYSSAKYVQRRFFTSQQWESLILDDLKANRPVIYRGSKESGGHAFVCDGYDGNGMFHINWGWNGMSNGYFLLSVLDPDLQGTGSVSGSYGYIENQAVVSNLRPASSSDVDPELLVYAKHIEVKSSSNTRTSTSANFSATLIPHFINCTDHDLSFSYGLGLYQGDRLVKVLKEGLMTNLQSWYYCYPTMTVDFGSGISSGTYLIKPIYSVPYVNSWKPCIGSDVNYVEVVINSLSCTITAHGSSTTPSYSINNIYVEGNMHPNRPVDVTLNVTNKGQTHNDIIYMFVNNVFEAMGFVDLEHGASGLVPFRYTPTNPSTVTLKFSLNEDGSSPIATRNITIYEMPVANLTGLATVLGVTDAANKIITANDYGVQLTVTNASSRTYDEDILIKLYKHIYGNTGTLVQASYQHVKLSPRQSTTLTFHLDNVMDGWKYFAKAYYYSSGEEVALAGTSIYTIAFPTASILGDVNGDGEVSIADVNLAVNYVLSNVYNARGDVNGDGEMTVADINIIVNLVLKQ